MENNRIKNNEKLQLTEKYRPKHLNDIISHNIIKEIIEKYIKEKDFPNVIFYGKAGIGKTSLIKSYINDMFNKRNNTNVLYINASYDRSIETIKTKVYSFVKSSTIENNLIKIVIFDEADNLTIDSQNIIKDLIGKNNTKYCFICNYEKNITQEIKSRCLYLKFFSLNNEDIRKKVKEICLDENIIISNDGLNKLIKYTNSDLRKLLNILQILKINYINKTIYEEDIEHYMNLISNKDLNDLIRLLENKEETIDKKIEIYEERYKKYDINNIINEIHNYLINKIINNEKYDDIINKIDKLADLELYTYNEFSLDLLIIYLINIFI